MSNHPITSCLKDIHLAAIVFGISLLALLITAALGLNSWPGQIFVPFLTHPSVRGFIGAFSGYAPLFSLLFWASMPTLPAQRLVFFSWPVSTIALWAALHDEVKISWFGDTELGAVTLLITGMGIPAFAALLWRVWRPPVDADSDVEANLRWLMVMMFLFALVPMSALHLTVSLHPQTFDIFALKFDAAAGWDITPQISDWVTAIPGANELLMLAYGFTPLAFFALTLAQLRGRPTHVPQALLLWVGMTLCALIAYHLFPVTGPKYVFGSAEYLARLRTPELLQLAMTSGAGPNPRNGMPSMHFGWAFGAFVVWLMSGTRRWSQVFLGVITVCVALATLYLGEHYVIDLIVAVPFVLGSIALCTTTIAWKHPERWRTVALGFGAWLVWILLLRTQTPFFIENPWACWLLLLATAAAVLLQSQALARYKYLVQASSLPTDVKPALMDGEQHLKRRLALMFFASGAAALMYQVLFAKELALIFGSTATATFTVLATFLGGMSIGSLAGGTLAARIKRPIVAYALIEFAIGGFCIITPNLFSAIQEAYVFLAADLPPDSPALLVLRVLLGTVVLLIPTILMGITLPLLAQVLNPCGERLGSAVAWLYAFNTGGAALGALLTSYAVIPFFGVRSTTLLAALLNFLVALGALELAKRYGERAKDLVQADLTPDTSPTETDKAGSPAQRKGRRVLIVAWLALGLGGVISLGLEVVYVHMLSIVAGNSVYAFGLMLATFLVGLAAGGELGRRVIEWTGANKLAWLAAVQIALAAMIACGSWGWDMIPAYFASYAGYPVLTSFGAREAVRGIVCVLIMVPPTICIGASYTLAMDLATAATHQRQGIKILGWSAAINTLGNILGVLLFGFVLLPWLGGLIASKIVAIGALVIALAVTAAVLENAKRLKFGAALCAGAALLVLSPAKLDYQLLSSGSNVYFSSQEWGTVIDHAESIDGGLTSVTHRPGSPQAIKTLLTNGKFQGNDAKHGEVQAQIGFAALPLLHQQNRKNALVIGYGTGATSRVFHDAGFEHLDIAELSRDVVTLADAHFSAINGKVSSQPRVKTHITDGRNLLLLTQRQYDVISIEITSIWFAGAASLYNREFYRLARSKLRASGVFQQWVQLHHMAPTDLLTIIGTLRSEFSYVSLYVVGGQGILISTNDAAQANALPSVIQELDASPELSQVRELAGRKFSDIAKDLLLSPQQIDSFLDRIGLNRALWISTDNNLRLEYNTPKANSNPHDNSFEVNLALLQRYKGRFQSPSATTPSLSAQ